MIGVSILLVVVPACSGAYLVARYFGSKKTSGGIYLLVFAIVACVAIILLPDIRLDQRDYSYTLPLILFISFVFGVALGVLTRHREDTS